LFRFPSVTETGDQARRGERTLRKDFRIREFQRGVNVDAPLLRPSGGAFWLPRNPVYWQLANASVVMLTLAPATGVTADVEVSSAGVATEQSRVVEDVASKAIASAVYAAAEICARAAPLDAQPPA
jgi:hypothetical protein